MHKYFYSFNTSKYISRISKSSSNFKFHLSRVLTGHIEPAYLYVETFPKYNDFLLGKSLPNPGGILPYEPERSSHIIGDRQNTNEMVQTTAPTAFWADAYANFGWFGVFTIPFFVGYVIYLADRIFLGRIPNPLTISLYVFSIVHYSKISVTTLGNYIVDLYLIGVILVSIIIYSRLPKANIIMK